MHLNFRIYAYVWLFSKLPPHFIKMNASEHSRACGCCVVRSMHASVCHASERERGEPSKAFLSCSASSTGEGGGWGTLRVAISEFYEQVGYDKEPYMWYLKRYCIHDIFETSFSLQRLLCILSLREFLFFVINTLLLLHYGFYCYS